MIARPATRLPLFQIAVPARPDSPPQVAGAEVAAKNAGRQALRILRLLAWMGPMTREEIVAHLPGLSTSSACGRLRELECPDHGSPAFVAPPPLVEKIGTRRSRCGVDVWCYAITPAGRKVICGR